MENPFFRLQNQLFEIPYMGNRQFFKGNSFLRMQNQLLYTLYKGIAATRLFDDITDEK